MYIENPTIKQLVNEKHFSNYYDNGLTSRFNALRLKHELTYGEKCGNQSFHLVLENEEYIYSLVLWEGGDCNVEALAVESENTVFNENFHFTSGQEFLNTYPETVGRLFSFGK